MRTGIRIFEHCAKVGDRVVSNGRFFAASHEAARVKVGVFVANKGENPLMAKVWITDITK